MTDVSPKDRHLYASVDMDFIGRNVCVYCASEGLAMIFHAAVDYPKLDKLMKLPEQQFVTFAHPVAFAHR